MPPQLTPMTSRWRSSRRLAGDRRDRPGGEADDEQAALRRHAAQRLRERLAADGVARRRRRRGRRSSSRTCTTQSSAAVERVVGAGGHRDRHPLAPARHADDRPGAERAGDLDAGRARRRRRRRARGRSRPRPARPRRVSARCAVWKFTTKPAPASMLVASGSGMTRNAGAARQLGPAAERGAGGDAHPWLEARSRGRAAHDPRDLEPRHERQRRADLVLAAADQVVDEPDARGADLDQHGAVAPRPARRRPRAAAPTGRSRIRAARARTAAPYPRGMELQEIVRAALAEDVGSGDATTLATVAADARARATITQKAPGVVFGLDAARGGVRASSTRRGRFERLAAEGAWQRAGHRVLRDRGPGARAADRRAHRAQPAAAPQRRRHADGALRPGRRGHRRADPRHAQDDAGPARAREGRGARPAAARTTASASTTRSSSRRTTSPRPAASAQAVERRAPRYPDLPLEVECRNPEEIDAGARGGRAADPARQHGPGRSCAPRSRRSRAAPSSRPAGGITLETVRDHAVAGLDFISVGALTHSAPALDLSLILEPLP